LGLFKKLLAKLGFVNEKPKEGADNKMVCFLHPKDINGVLIELCMENRGLQKEYIEK